MCERRFALLCLAGSPAIWIWATLTSGQERARIGSYKALSERGGERAPNTIARLHRHAHTHTHRHSANKQADNLSVSHSGRPKPAASEPAASSQQLAASQSLRISELIERARCWMRISIRKGKLKPKKARFNSTQHT